jgi:cytochrome o ubiquinol oxidase subunit IV
MSAAAVYLAIGTFAVVKAVVHSDALHIDPPRQNMDDLYLILFSILFLLFMIGGTIWILSILRRDALKGR